MAIIVFCVRLREQPARIWDAVSVPRRRVVQPRIRGGPWRACHLATADQLWPFTSREYGRLLFLRSLVDKQRHRAS
jgi:hypothetical protein